MVIVEKEAKGSGKAAGRYARSVAQYLQSAMPFDAGHEDGIALAVYLPGHKAAKATEERVLALGGYTQGYAINWEQAWGELERRLAKRSRRSKKPARHAIVSLPEGEQFEQGQCDDVARVLAAELGCEPGLIMWALHGDTNNQHLHLLILTLDADGKATEYGPRGQSREAMQRAIARLEHAFDLQPEQHARYEAGDHGVRRKRVVDAPAKKRAPIKPHVLQWEADTGLQSFTRFAQEVLAAELEAAASWDDAQAKLAEYGTMVLKAGSGGEIRSADMLYKVKLTHVDRTLRWAALIERWGDWSEPVRPQQQYEPKVLDPQAALKWVARDELRRPARSGVQGRITRLRDQRAAEIARLEEEYAVRAADLTAMLDEHGNLPRNALRSALHGIYAARIENVKAQIDHHIAALCALRSEVDDAPSLDGIDLGAIAAPDFSFEIGWPQTQAGTVEHTGYRTEQVGQSIQYWSRTSPSLRPAFIERGDRIWMVDQSDAALTAALVVAQARYGVVAAHGDAAFIRRARQMGRALGIDIQDGQSHDQIDQPRPASPARTNHWQGRLLAVRSMMAARAKSRAFANLIDRGAYFDERHNDVPHEPGDQNRIAVPMSPPPNVKFSPPMPPAIDADVAGNGEEGVPGSKRLPRRSGLGRPPSTLSKHPDLPLDIS